MANLRLTLACGPYDRTQAIIDGNVRAEGIDITYLALQPAEIFWRQLQYGEFDVSEMSMSNYTTTLAAAKAKGEKPPFIAIPVFPSRVFRHGYFFYNPEKFKGGFKSPKDLEGRRGGVPEYSMTAAVYMRGLLQHDYGVDLSKLSWLQSRTSRIAHGLPPGVVVEQAPPGTELGDLVEAGELDFMMTANNPLAFRRGSAKCVRMFPNYVELEKDYFKRTRIYPIMHTVVIKREIYDRDPWVALALYKAFCAAKDRAYRMLLDAGSPKASFAWLQPMIEEEQRVFGKDWYPYGIENNRETLNALCQFTHEHALTDQRLSIEDLFAPSTLRDIPLGEGQHI
jgi:4,5-dihydroxyphthalate decarboxylase